jgi:hypothetical protein
VPWTVEDVEQHRKGLPPADKQTWVTIANKALLSGRSWDFDAVRVSLSDPTSQPGSTSWAGWGERSERP